MVAESRLGKTAPNTKESIRTDGRRAMESSVGAMEPVLKDNSSIITFKEKGFTSGLINVSMMGIGKRIRCMGKEFSNGLMEKSMKVSTLKIRRKVMEFSLGTMEDSMKANGRTVNSMAWEQSKIRMENELKANGLMVNA